MWGIEANVVPKSVKMLITVCKYRNTVVRQEKQTKHKAIAVWSWECSLLSFLWEELGNFVTS